MSIRRTQREVDSAEFSEWVAFYLVEQELSGGEQAKPSNPDQLGDKIRGWAAMHNAKEAGMKKGRR